MTMTELRVVTIVPQANPAVLRVRPSDGLSLLMGRFTPARYVKSAHAYDMPADLAGAFETFCRLHAIVVLDEPASMTGSPMPTNSAQVLTILDEQRARKHDPDAQQATNDRGIALVRLAMRLAIIKREHRAR